MTTLREAVANLIKVKGRHNTEIAYQKLIEAFDADKPVFCGCGDQIMPDDGAECGTCVTARNAVKPEPEPVAQVRIAEDYHAHVFWMVSPLKLDQRYLYAAPPQREWQGLTDKEIEELRHIIDWTAGWSYGNFARAIEAKLKEKNA